MYMQREATSELRPDQVRAIAHGLYYLAEIDGVTESEKDLIESFLEEGKVELEVESLAKMPFSLEEVLYSLDTMFLRKTFLRICILLAQADGEVSPDEKAELRRLAQALHITEPLESLAEGLETRTLD